MPITWRNVNGPDFSGVSETLGRAGESLTEGVDAIRKGKDTFEKGRTDRNTQAFMDQLAQYGSPEELAAAQESGQVAKMRDQFGSMINRDRTDSDAITDRVTGLRKEQTANRNYDASEKAFGNRDALNQFQEAIAARDMEGAQAIKDNNDFANDGQLQQQITGVADYRANEFIKGEDRQFALDKRNITRQDWKREKDKRQLTERISGLVSESISGYDEKTDSVTSVRNRLRKGMPDNATPAQVQQAEDLLTQRLDSRGKLATSDRRDLDNTLNTFDENFNDGQGIGSNIYYGNTPENAGMVSQELADKYTVDGELLGEGDNENRLDIRNQMRRMLGEGVTINGENIPVPKEVMDATLSSVKDSDYNWNSYDDLEVMVIQTMKDPFFGDQMEQHDTWKNQRTRLEAAGLQAYIQGNPAAPKATPADAPTTRLNPPPQAGATGGWGNNAPSPQQTPATEPTPTPLPKPRPNPRSQSDVPVMDRKLGPYLELGALAVGDWFSDMRAGNKASIVKGLRGIANSTDQPDMGSRYALTKVLRTNAFALKELNSEERNALRDKFGAATINRYMD